MLSEKENREKIIYVDDDEMMLYVFQRTLSKYYDVLIANNPEEAIQLLDREDISVVVSDQAMPKMTGIELLQKVMKKFPDRGRILITGNDNMDIVKEAVNLAEINQFISKPWNDDGLKFAIDKVVETCRLKRENIDLQEQLKKTIDYQKEILQSQKRVLKLNLSVLKKLNSSKNVKNGKWEKGIIEFTETLSQNMKISRVSVWTYNSEKDAGSCIDLYCLENHSHKSGYMLDKNNYDGITDVIKNEWIIQVENVHKNAEGRLPTSEYLQRHNICSVLYIPFYIGRKIFGVLACEQQYEPVHWSNDEVQFIYNTTDIIRLTYRTHERMLVEKELKEAYDELNATHSQLVLSEKMASLGQLTAGIAHEINNPINFVYAGINALDKNIEHSLKLTELYTSMNGGQNVDLLNQIKELNQRVNFDELKIDIRSLIKDIRIGATRTAEIVKGLRNFSRLDEAERKMANIHEGIDSTLILLRNQISDHIQLIKKFDENISLIYCYPGQLNQVFMNLLSNAIHAIDDKGKIEITTINADEHVEIHFKDSGVGIPEEVREKIFDPFFTTKDVGEGTGLGLSISYGIIEKHNGSIKVESKEGKGTKFVISLPKEMKNA